MLRLQINLRHGIRGMTESRETCTACAGTMILEMAALSRLTGNPLYEQKAHKAMDRLWKIRHRLAGLNVTALFVISYSCRIPKLLINSNL